MRLRAAQGCIDRFRGKPYEPGKRDCCMMALHALRQMNVRVPFSRKLRYRSEAEGLKVLRSLGFKTLFETLDSLGLPRIAPAMAGVGDIVALECGHRFGSLAIWLGNGTALTFTEETGTAEIMTDITGFARDESGDPMAWRVIDG
ncbi:hypothetical protein [Brevundimonas sp. S30B]|uniref:DUF6950 family protein n=2 Tax=unclassified Brevundimonas TaxID=2622653 RepID=UPI00352C13AC